MKCFDCGDNGHIAANCPNADVAADGRPPWCGLCDERTRLIGVPGDKLARCQECHPDRRSNLGQHRRCPACKMIVHQWDTAPCGSHSSPTAVKDRRPSRTEIDTIIARERVTVDE